MEKNARVEKKRRVSKSFCKFIVSLKKEKHALKTRASIGLVRSKFTTILTALEIKKNRDISLNLRG